MIEYWKTCLNKYADFNGRARRSEFWYFVLVNLLIIFGLYILGFVLGTVTKSPLVTLAIFVILVLYSLATLIPNIAVTVRRLHDIGKSGSWYFISFVPFIGGIWLLILMSTDSMPGENEYGKNPKEINTDLS